MIAGVFDAAGEPAADVARRPGRRCDRAAARARFGSRGPAGHRRTRPTACSPCSTAFSSGRRRALEEVVAAWRADGVSLAERLRGAFTLVVWDERRTARRGRLRPVLAARVPDARVRERPARASRRTCPRSGACCRATRRPTRRVIAPWIAPHYLQGHRTMMEGVERVGAARLLELGEDGWRRRRYWRPEWRETIDASWDELVELLRRSCGARSRERIDGAERAGTILSGGVDSSVVLATAAGSTRARTCAPTRRSSRTGRPPTSRTGSSRPRRRWTFPSARFAVRPQGALRLALEQLRDSGTVPGGPGRRGRAPRRAPGRGRRRRGAARRTGRGRGLRQVPVPDRRPAAAREPGRRRAPRPAAVAVPPRPAARRRSSARGSCSSSGIGPRSRGRSARAPRAARLARASDRRARSTRCTRRGPGSRTRTSRAGGRTTRTCSATTSRGAASASTSGSAAPVRPALRARRSSTSELVELVLRIPQRVQLAADRPAARTRRRSPARFPTRCG